MRGNYNNQADWATIGGKTKYFRSKFERRWAAYLQMLKDAGEILEWEYEPQKFDFSGVRRGTTCYTPDFKVIIHDRHIWHECKGHLHQKDVTKFRRMAKYHPDERIVLVMQGITKKNKLRAQQAEKYIYRVMEGFKILRTVGL